MRRTFTIIATALLGFGLVSCSTSDDVAEQPSPSTVTVTASPTSERAQQPTKPPAEQSSRLYYSIAECHLPEALSSTRLTPFLRPGATPTAWSYEGESNYNPCMI